MSIHKSLKVNSALARHRNVLSRSERVAALEEEGRWQDGDPVYGLPKVANRKVKKKAKVAKAEAEPGAEGATTEATGESTPGA